METVKCTTKATGTWVIAKCWVLRNGKHIALTRTGIDLPKGDYELQWEFRADVGSTFVATVTAKDITTGDACTTGAQTIAHGQTHIGSGSDKPNGYTAKTFRVA